jgi:hypothetical protein
MHTCFPRCATYAICPSTLHVPCARLPSFGLNPNLKEYGSTSTRYDTLLRSPEVDTHTNGVVHPIATLHKTSSVYNTIPPQVMHLRMASCVVKLRSRKGFSSWSGVVPLSSSEQSHRPRKGESQRRCTCSKCNSFISEFLRSILA